MTMTLGPHAAFIIASYAIAAAVVAALAAWITLDRRKLVRDIAELEERGITRRSARSRGG